MAYKVNIGATEMSGNLTVNPDYAYYGDGSNLSGITSTTITTTTRTAAGNYYIPFVNESTGDTDETLYIHDTIGLNPDTDVVTLQGALTIGAALAGGTSYSGSAGLSGSSLVLGGGNAYVDVDGVIAGSSLTDGTATITGGAASGLTTVAMGGALSGVTTLALSSTITGGTSYSGSTSIESQTVSAEGAITGGSLTDSTATLSAGALSGVTTIALNSTITGGTSYSGSAGLSGSSLVLGGGSAYIDVGGGAMFDGILQVDGRLDIGNGMRYDSVAVKTNDFTLTNANSIIIASGSAAIDLTLPGSPTAGEFYTIKRHASMQNDVTILSASAGGGASIDGDSTIELHTAGAAVSLVYEDTTDTWSLF
jgi:hypothetical protein